MIDAYLEMPDDEPIFHCECPNCLFDIEHSEGEIELLCDICEEIFKVQEPDTFLEEEYDY